MKRSYLLIVLFIFAFTSISPTVAQESDRSLQISVLAWNPDGNMIAVGYEDGYVEIIDIDQNHIIRWHAHNLGLINILWNNIYPNVIATAGFDRTVKIWNINELDRVTNIPDLQFTAIWSMEWDPSGNILSITQQNGDPNFSIWDQESQDFIYRESIRTAIDIQWDNKNQLMAVGYFNPMIELRDATTYEVLSTIQLENGITDANLVGIQTVEWHPYNNFILVSELYGTISVWNTDDNTMIFRARITDIETDKVALLYSSDSWFSENGNEVHNITADDTYRVWNTYNGQLLLDFNLNALIPEATVSSDKFHLAYVDENNDLHIVAINDLITEQIRLKVDDCSAPETLTTTLNAYLDNGDSLGFIEELATLDENALSAECVAQLTAMTNLLTEDEAN